LKQSAGTVKESVTRGISSAKKETTSSTAKQVKKTLPDAKTTRGGVRAASAPKPKSTSDKLASGKQQKHRDGKAASAPKSKGTSDKLASGKQQRHRDSKVASAPKSKGTPDKLASGKQQKHRDGTKSGPRSSERAPKQGKRSIRQLMD
jgi:hypothetical protein